ncbi:uncharacterized protein LDX57_008372 [Aspergillus melleus]|uniref:uncharacterized protein n=1 Tax=Aspergillus melleus TaxID=138277 RepID=UPI001E8E6F3A|nr:uncharacterized protein LDX57_008372 [Aspergillus melleus]KAH8430710.1 hypothetical protein LDX57_008372 [Aspergillus melleus]
MKLATALPLTLLSAITLLPSTSAWKFTWRDDEGNESTESGKGPHACTKIQHAEGEEFAWNNQGNKNIGIYLYTSSDCSGSLAGWSSNIWEKESSRDLLSFKVANEGATTTADATATESHTSSADATKTATATATATNLTSGGASNSTVSGSSSAVGSKTKTKTDTSATASSSPASSKTASGSTAESSGSSATATGESGSSTPSSTASATDGASTDESSASSLSKHNAAIAVTGLVLGIATYEWVI